MTTETIALLTILRDETQSRSVFDRCEAELASLMWAKPDVNAIARSTTVTCRILPGGENEAGVTIYRNGYVVFVR
jgi:hypothetical protein